MSGTTSTYTAEQLRQEMRRVREDLREDVQEVVEGAQDLTDWRHYVRSYPWACIGVAAVAGYLLVPNKTYIHSPDADDLKKLAASNKLCCQAVACRPAFQWHDRSAVYTWHEYGWPRSTDVPRRTGWENAHA